MSTAKKMSVVLVIALMVVVGVLVPVFAQEKVVPLRFLGLGDWYPSEIAIEEIAPLFDRYAREHLGYGVEIHSDYAPFTSLYEKIAAAFDTGEDLYDVIIIDSQWLGAFAVPGHIIPFNRIIEENPGLNNAVSDMYDVHVTGYMTYPDGSDRYWGLPQLGDHQVLYVRKDLLANPAERAAFLDQYGFELPLNYEDFVDLDWATFEHILAFFHRPDEGFYGLATQYSEGYDYLSTPVMSMIWTWGGDIINWDTWEVDGYINAPEAVAALEYVASLLKYAPPDVLSYGINEVATAYSRGNIFCGWTWVAVGANVFDPDISEVWDKTMVVLPPGKRNEDGTLHRVYGLGGQPWVISAHSGNQDAAIDFITWWYTDEIQWLYAEKGGLPSVRSIIDTETFQNLNQWNRAYVDMIPQSKDFWHLPNYAELLHIQQEEWWSYLSDSFIGALDDPHATAQRVMDNVARRQEESLREWGFLD